MLITKQKTRFISFLLSLTLLAGLTACSGRKSTPAEGASLSNAGPYYTFQDDAGNMVTLDEKPENVAVLFSSFADIWKTAGGKVSITVGESVERGFADADAVLVDSGAGKTINQELLLESRPDLVVCTADLSEQVKAAETMRQAGIPAAVFHVEEFSDYLRVLKICTDICETPEIYETCGAGVQDEIRQVLDAIPQNSGQEKKILFVRAGSKYSATKAKTAADNFVCVMLKELGTYNIAENAPVLLDGLSFEEILSAQPDYIFISTMGDEEAAKAYMKSVLAEETWQSLEAVQKGNYTYLPKDLFQYKPNARWGEAYRYLYGVLYGEG